MSIKNNAQQLIEEIEQLRETHRLLHPITICAATKYGDVASIQSLIEAGITTIGENRVDALLEKKQALKDPRVSWHFIGTLQSRKVKQAIHAIDCLHSLDRLSLAKAIEKHRQLPIDCYVQVNVANEPTKHGLSPSELMPFIQSLATYQKIRVIGLMTMAPETNDQVLLESIFTQLKQLGRDVQALGIPNCSCHGLSMGMSNDYAIAIKAGATIVRIGSKLYREKR